MKILLSNDDGIYAPGMHALYNALRDLGEITIVAPDSQRSASSNAITLHDPIRIKKVKIWDDCNAYAISGTPADCVKLAIRHLLPEPPDIVISGINLGPNIGNCVLYSGTVSAATEGTMLGCPSMAISLAAFFDPIWDSATHFARKLTLTLHKRGMPDNVLLNANIPNLPLDQIRGIKVTRMGTLRFEEEFDERKDPQGNTYYWLNGSLATDPGAPDTDIYAINNGFVSITPIGLDRTHEHSLTYLRSWEI